MKRTLAEPKAIIFPLTFLLLPALASQGNIFLPLKRLLLILAVSWISEYTISIYQKLKKPDFLSAVVIAETIFLIASLSVNTFQILLATVSAIGGKHYLKVGEKQLLNPSAFGLFIAGFFGLTINWWGLLPGIIFSTLIILTTGFVSVYKQRQELIIISFLLTVIILSFLFSGNLFASFAQILLGSFWFFTMVLLPDPETAPFLPKLKIAYGALTAFLAFFIAKFVGGVEPLTTSLLISNLLFWYIEKSTLRVD